MRAATATVRRSCYRAPMSDESRDEGTPSSARAAGAVEDDYARRLGVIEALTSVSQQCPNGAVRAVAAQAIESIKARRTSGLRDQVYYVLTAIQGWRGDRARQVHESLMAYLEGDP